MTSKGWGVMTAILAFLTLSWGWVGVGAWTGHAEYWSTGRHYGYQAVLVPVDVDVLMASANAVGVTLGLLAITLACAAAYVVAAIRESADTGSSAA